MQFAQVQLVYIIMSLHTATVMMRTDDDCVSQSKGWAKLTPIQSLLTLSTPVGAPARMLPSRTRSYPQPS